MQKIAVLHQSKVVKWDAILQNRERRPQSTAAAPKRSSFSVIGMHLNGDKITLNLMRGIKGKIGFGCYTFNTSSFSDDDVIIKVQ